MPHAPTPRPYAPRYTDPDWVESPPSLAVYNLLQVASKLEHVSQWYMVSQATLSSLQLTHSHVHSLTVHLHLPQPDRLAAGGGVAPGVGAAAEGASLKSLNPVPALKSALRLRR